MVEVYETRETVVSHELLDIAMELIHPKEGVSARDEREVHERHRLSRNIGDEFFVGRVREVPESLQELVSRRTGSFSERRVIPLASHIVLGFIQVDFSEAIEVSKSEEARRTSSNDTDSLERHSDKNYKKGRRRACIQCDSGGVNCGWI